MPTYTGALKNITTEKIEGLALLFTEFGWEGEKDNDIDFLLNAIFFEYIIDRNKEKIKKVINFLKDEDNTYHKIWENMIHTDGVRLYYVGYMYNAFQTFLKRLAEFWRYIGYTEHAKEADYLANIYLERYSDILDGGISDAEGNIIEPAYKFIERYVPDRIPEWNFKEVLEKHLAEKQQVNE